MLGVCDRALITGLNWQVLDTLSVGRGLSSKSSRERASSANR